MGTATSGINATNWATNIITNAMAILIHGSLLDGPGSLAESGGQVFFATYNNPLNELVFSELYKTDGTVNGTVFIQDFIDTTQNVTLD